MVVVVVEVVVVDGEYADYYDVAADVVGGCVCCIVADADGLRACLLVCSLVCVIDCVLLCL